MKNLGPKSKILIDCLNQNLNKKEFLLTKIYGVKDTSSRSFRLYAVRSLNKMVSRLNSKGYNIINNQHEVFLKDEQTKMPFL